MLLSINTRFFRVIHLSFCMILRVKADVTDQVFIIQLKPERFMPNEHRVELKNIEHRSYA